LEELANDLWSSLRPEGQAQALLVSRICRIYAHWNRLDRYQQAITTLAGEKELRIPTVELGDPVDVEELERDCANVIERCKEELASNESISAELMEALHPCVGPRRHYDLEQLRDEIDHPTSLGENIKEKNDGIDRRKERFLAIVNSGVAVSLREVQLSKQIYDQVASARFDQYILPEEGDLRKILRYRSMLDHELSFCLDQLDRLKKIRIANPSSNLCRGTDIDRQLDSTVGRLERPTTPASRRCCAAFSKVHNVAPASVQRFGFAMRWPANTTSCGPRFAAKRFRSNLISR